MYRKTILEKKKRNHHYYYHLLAGLAAVIVAAVTVMGIEDFLSFGSFAVAEGIPSAAAQEAAKDTTKPTGTITSPASGDVVKLNTPITVNGTASDNVKVSKVEVRAVNAEDILGTRYAPATSTDGYASWTFSLTIPNTDYENITVRITDTSGNQKWMTHRVSIAAEAAEGPT
ncbi:hypothetical protein NTE_00577 [Candidatus Nitrososphaera evergladensis SR1]|uniref:Bacterial Ig domain-containing protein n=1 Tax=Candidatus Nitrososphaera evergladensis SR1 TaxID=1459636 RepID=A0A075MN23_9ARCH|nr:Ig-like domain-containing protein [Candidatus Nitrososphaera evergladensis]AIF82658.1 hypothetical protein NTE_00577 [Candidatus Nitrososphaera evergladensis SR1]